MRVVNKNGETYLNTKYNNSTPYGFNWAGNNLTDIAFNWVLIKDKDIW